MTETDLEKIFGSFGLKKSARSITDWGAVHRSAANFYEVFPETLSDVYQIIDRVGSHQMSLRVRGNGHSMNGSSLPKKGELLIRSDRLNYYRFEENGSITAGAGISPADLDTFLATDGYRLFSSNKGGGGPTLGGYISAGGIGFSKNNSCPGFWKSVLEIVFITPTGKVMRCKKDDELFPWIFGSMGQFGFIVEAKIKIFDQIPDLRLDYPRNRNGKINRSSVTKNEALRWYEIFSSLDQEKEAILILKHLAKKYSNYCNLVEIERFFLKSHLHPPLLYPINDDFVANIMWLEPKNIIFDRKIILKISQEYHQRILANPHLRRYIQTEIFSKKMDFKNYFGKAIYSKFLALKKEFDPKMLLNRGTVF